MSMGSRRKWWASLSQQAELAVERPDSHPKSGRIRYQKKKMLLRLGRPRKFDQVTALEAGLLGEGLRRSFTLL
jgi:hypothetical protein